MRAVTLNPRDFGVIDGFYFPDLKFPVIPASDGAGEIVPTFQKRARLQGINVGNRDMFEAMNRAVAVNGLRPVVDRVYPFEQAVDAFKALGEGRHFGKIGIVF